MMATHLGVVVDSDRGPGGRRPQPAAAVGDAYRGLRQPPPGHELHGEAGSDES